MSAWLRRPLSWGMWLFTVLVIGCLFAAGLVFYVHVANRAQDAKAAASRQLEGRAIAIDVLCGGLRGVERAGKLVLQGQLPGQSGRGLPPRTVTTYVRIISNAVLDQAGVRAADVLLPGGTIDCNRLRRQAKATSP